MALQALLLSRDRSEEHTSELQSHSDIVCRLLLEKKKDAMTWKRIFRSSVCVPGRWSRQWIDACPFFFNDTATTEIYTLSLHDALPICRRRAPGANRRHHRPCHRPRHRGARRSEDHTSELQSHSDLVCRLLLEKKK